MGYYVIKKNQDVGGSAVDFYYYESVVGSGTTEQAHWGTDSSKKEIFGSQSDAEAIFDDEEKFPPNFRGAVVESE
tara:strand:+ start:4794 stop:5018 length:225 start_codon:yes stop_codon:yes gene_type:complete